MKLKPPERFNSFYESFSDLIFGTMAIFVFLMMVFLVLINEGDAKKRHELEQKLAQATAATKRAQDHLKTVLEEFAELERAVRTKGLELVIAVDRTGSMKDGLLDLTETLNVFSSVITQYVPEYRIAILAYHENPVLFLEMPMTIVLPADKDGGQSQAKVGEFLTSITPAGGAAPVEEAVKRALRIHTANSAFHGAHVFMIIGDVGPFESGVAASDNPQVVDSLITYMSAWAAQSKMNKVVSVYADKGCSVQNGCVLPEESKAFFRRACQITSDRNECSNLSSEQMLIHLLRSVVVTK